MAQDDFIKRNHLTILGQPNSSSKEAAAIFKIAGMLEPTVSRLLPLHFPLGSPIS